MKVDHLSASQINMFSKCPAQWYFRYVKKLKFPPPWKMQFGTCFHKALGHNYKQKVESRMDLKTSEIQEVFAEDFKKRKEDIDWREKDPTLGEIVDRGTNLVETYQEELGIYTFPVIEPEQEMKINIIDPETNEDKFFIRGFVDLETENEIIDFKTSAKTPSFEQLDVNTAYQYSYSYFLQLGLYKLKDLKKLSKIHYGIHLKRSSKAIDMDVVYTIEDVRSILKIADKIYQAIQSEIFYPNRNSLYCTPNMCGYWKICHQEF